MLNSIVFDRAAESVGALARLKLTGELARVKVGLKGAANALTRLKQVAHANQIRVSLGVSKTNSGEARIGKFGPIFDQFRHDAKGAIAHLMKHRTGEATAALHHAAVGDIDMIWGKEGTAAKDYMDGFGLAKIARKHPEVLGDLQGFLNGLKKNEARSGTNRTVLESPDKNAIVSLDWLGQQKKWLLTAYVKENGLTANEGSIGVSTRAESVPPTDQEVKPNGNSTPDNDAPQAPRNPTAQYYEFDPNRKPAQRKKDNAEAMALLKRIDAGEVDATRLMPEEKQALAKYSGTGGALIGADGKKGSAYEYYTPKPIAEGIWTLMGELGFAGGKVLDPCAGVGVFGATAPLSAAIDAVELNETSGRINGLVNAGPGYTATVSPFEKVAAATPDEQYDAVVTNVPFGGVADRGGNQLHDDRYQKEPLQNYFILRSLEKLRPGGLAVFITPPRCVSGKGGKEEELRVKASYMAEFLGAYRLPNEVFGTASADTMTDVIAFRKYDLDTLDKIAELREQSPAVLVEANVQWQPFINGRYFDGEGKRFVLGEFVPKDPAKFRDVDRVTTKLPVGEIGRMLKRFPKSRVDWDALGASETTPIIYRDGDTITQAGQTLQMQDGRWVPLSRSEASASMAGLAGKLKDPYTAFEAGVSWADAEQCVNHMVETSQSLDIPGWLRGARAEIHRLKADEQRAQFWNAGLVGLAAAQVLEERLGEETGVNFLADYPALSDAMQRSASVAKKRPAALGGKLRDALALIGTHYQKKIGFSAIWRGDVQSQTPTVEITADASFEGLRYKTKSAWVSMDDAKGIYGADFDPYANADWCVSPDGKSVTRADDYYVGNYAEFLRRVDGEIAAAASDDIRAKLLRQKLDAAARIDRVDVSKLTFNLFSPHVTPEGKAEFLRRFVHPSAAVVYDEKTGGKRVDIDVRGSNLTDRDKLLNRIGDYLKNGTITLGGAKLGMSDAEALRELRRMVNTANEQFNGWVRGNRSIMARLESVASDPAKLRFRQVEDEAPMPIPGMNPDLTLHGYQNAFVRKTSREFGGINGFGVGLGKAQPLDAKILTPDGWKLMGDIHIGDKVIAVDGTAVPVTGVYPQGEKEIFEIEFSDGAKTRSCDEHLWWTETENDRKKSLYHSNCGRNKKFGDVKSLREIRSTLVSGKKQKNHKIPLVYPIQFSEKNLPIRPYLMGVLLGDGNFTHKTVGFTSPDSEIVSRVKHLLKDAFGDSISLNPRISKNRAPSYGISKTDFSAKNPVRLELDRYGLCEKNSLGKFIHDDYLYGSVEQRIELLRGLMDTDGYVSKDGITIQFSSISKGLADGVVQLVQSLGGIAWISSKIPTFTYRGERRIGNESFTVSMRMPPEINPFHLERKAQSVKPKTKYLPVRYFARVESVGMAQAQCISIDHPTHLYVTDDFIVTHNTFTALAATQYAQSIGVKSKTAFVVPNSVLSNWRKEAARAYANTDDCLFIGLRVDKNGKATVSASNFDADLTAVMENRHSKIFMTLEAFERIRLRDDTIADYEHFMRMADASFAESMDKKADERAKGKQAGLLSVLSEKRGAAPHLEEMGIDSLVIDEAHCFPAGTLVDGIPIEQIKVGDFVQSFNHETGQIEMRRVTNTMNRRAIGLVRVHLKTGQSIVCTHDHPFFVPGTGYVAAEFLNNAYSVVSNYSKTENKDALQPLQNGFRAIQTSDMERQEGGQDFLLQGVRGCSQREEGTDVSTLCSVREGVRVEPRSELESSNGEGGQVLLQPVVFDRVEAFQLRDDAGSNEQRNKTCKTPRGFAGAQLATDSTGSREESTNQACQRQQQRSENRHAGRQWQPDAGSAENVGRCVAVADGICGENRSKKGQRNTLPLQTGCSASTTQDCSGSGWSFPSMGESPGIGCEKGYDFEVVGVDRVEVLQYTSDGGFGGLCPGGMVYDITVDGNHNFFADGILVHNCYKNSAATVDFKSAKYLSLSPASKRGIDAQAKAWFIRGKSTLKDGVLLLTATPITNSPLEIYAMLSLAAGHERVNDMCLGIKGADNFMEMMCAKENQDDVTMDDVARTADVFVGLNNVDVLRKAIGETATIKSAEDVGGQIVVPDREEKAAPVTLPPDIVERLKRYKGAFRYAIDEIAEKSPNRGDKAAYDEVAAHFGEKMELIGHPFNLINKMTLLIADPELDQRATFYSFIKAQSDKAKDAVTQFNAKKFIEERPRPGPMTEEAAIVGHKTIKDAATGAETELQKIHVQARVIEGTRIVIDTIDPDTQSAFETIAEKLGLDLDVSVPPKLAAMLENFQHEQASPRGIDADGQPSNIVKQIIFCDILPLHNKIKRLLTRRAGIPASRIAVITGRTNNSPDEILAVQDGFNAAGEDNRYQTVIANEKAEVGINLQKGTQAIHHLTIGWTPDSLEQRNGRGVRQGNQTARVSLYYYDADGTFDTSKRAMVNKKADWIGQVMDVNGSGQVAVTGGLSKEQMEALIDVVGDADAMRRVEDSIAAKEAQNRAASNREKQLINLDTIRKQNDFLSDNPSADQFIIRKIIGLWKMQQQADKLRERIGNPKATASAVAKNENLLAELTASMGGLRGQIEASAKLSRTFWQSGGTVTEAATLDDFFTEVRKEPRKQRDNDIADLLNGRSYRSFTVETIEGGAITNEWQAEIDMAQSMIDEAKASFARQAGENGSYPAELAEDIASGKGILYEGKPLTQGTFVRIKGEPGGLAVVTLDRGNNPRVIGWTLNGERLQGYTEPMLADGEWVYRCTADYDACLTEAAQIEDALNAGGAVNNPFSEVIPEVAQRRKTEALTAYGVSEYRLPPPYFPFVITPDEAEQTEIMRRIFNAQKTVIRDVRHGQFIVPANIDVTRGGYADYEARFDALREFATAHSLKLTLADFGGSDAWVKKQIEKTVSLDDLAATLTGEDATQIREQARAFLQTAAPWFDWQDKDPASDFLPFAFVHAIGEAVRSVAGGEPAGELPSDVVGITGNTLKWKRAIKVYAERHGDGKYRWDKSALTWNVYRSTWDTLIAEQPQARKELQLVAATQSL